MKERERQIRNQEIFDQVERGVTLATIGRKYNITRERVRQIDSRIRAERGLPNFINHCQTCGIVIGRKGIRCVVCRRLHQDAYAKIHGPQYRKAAKIRRHKQVVFEEVECANAGCANTFIRRVGAKGRQFCGTYSIAKLKFDGCIFENQRHRVTKIKPKIRIRFIGHIADVEKFLGRKFSVNERPTIIRNPITHVNENIQNN